MYGRGAGRRGELCRVGLCVTLGSPTCGVEAVSTYAALPMQPCRYLCISISTCAVLKEPVQPYRYLRTPTSTYETL